VGVFWGEFKERECREGKVCSEEMVMVAIGKQNEKLRTREQRSNLQVIRKWLIRGSWAVFFPLMGFSFFESSTHISKYFLMS